jgi:hypothetical protein
VLPFKTRRWRLHGSRVLSGRGARCHALVQRAPHRSAFAATRVAMGSGPMYVLERSVVGHPVRDGLWGRTVCDYMRM